MLIYLPLHSNPILAERGDYLDGKNTKFLFFYSFIDRRFLFVEKRNIR